MPRVKQNCPKKMKWEGGVERPCTPAEEDAGTNSDGDTSAASESQPDEQQPPPASQLDTSDSLSTREKTSPLRSESRSGGETTTVAPQLSRSSSRMSNKEVINKPVDSEEDEEILDFSKKKKSAAVKLGKSTQIKNAFSESSPIINAPPNNDFSPLDLSCSRKRTAQPVPVSENVKHQRTNEFAKNWNPSNFPFYNNNKTAAKDEWNGGVKTPVINVKKFPETSKSLNELSKLGEDMFRSQLPARQTAWQSHWVNKGSMEKNKEVFKCVWCKSSFHTLAQLTTHMKETSHCNSNATAAAAQNSTSNSKNSNSDLNLIIKETMPLPRKLVRGQDVWLGKGAEQTRQILKCMWCGQSFRSLAEMTNHMQQTQHYTNIISQEQIISWKAAEENANTKATSSGSQSAATPTPPPSSQQSHVTAVLTCKVCDQAFSSLKDLSAHMVKNSHYKEHIMRSITESGGRRRQNREKRKKSLPVRKLLELERAQHELNSTKNGSEIKKLASSSKISCEKCGEKIDTGIFVEHIRLCVGNTRNLLKSALLSNESNEKGDQNKETNDSTSSTSPSVLNAIEKLIEKSFDSRNRQNFQSMPNPNLGASILKRLGIDESSDYTKPIVDPSTLIRNYHHQTQHQRNRSGSESSSRSQTPDRKSNISQHAAATNLDDSSQPSSPVLKTDSTPISLNPPSNKESDDDEKNDSCKRTPSPTNSEKSNTSVHEQQAIKSNNSDSEVDNTSNNKKKAGEGNNSTKSLNALSNMFDNLSGKSSNGNTGGSSHPLAALQKLCDYTDRTAAAAASTTNTTTNTNPGAILAFTWACNDAIVNNSTSDSIIKCAFCDTPFISKGAYRHHLSKMHFVKEGGGGSDVKSPQSTTSTNKSLSPPIASTSSSMESNATRRKTPSPSENNSTSNNNNNNTTAATTSTATTPPATASTSHASTAASPSSSTDDSPHSKFLKYTELAKQLSSKYV